MIEKYPGNAAAACPRHPGIALLLSICPGLGQQYAGHLVRGIAAYAALIVASWLAAIAFMFTESRLSMLFLGVPFIGMALIAIDAYLCARRQPADYCPQWFNKVWLYPAVFAGLLVTVNPLMDLVVGDKIVRAFFVTADSMAPAVLEHDLVLINKLIKPRPGDIVLLDFSSGEGSSKVSEPIEGHVLRRIIAGPGDSVEITGRQVLVNGTPVNEPYANYDAISSHDSFTDESYRLGPQKVAPDSFFVLSDARHVGLDSRLLGTISSNRVTGVATKVFWSWNLDEGHFQWNRTALSLKQR